MTGDEHAEHALLSLMTSETHKFAIAVDYPLTQAQQDALERLQLRDWIRLIDVSSIACMPVTAFPVAVFRVFHVMPEAVRWFEKGA